MSIVKRLFLLVSVVTVLFSLTMVVMAANVPYGATPTEQAEDTATPDTAQSHGAIAGNVTEISIVGFSTTLAWQGYYGNVSGSVQLADSDDNIMYNWSLASPEGEVFSSTNSTLIWTNIQCFNLTADGDQTGNLEASKGGTNTSGMNHTQLEALFNIDSDDVDGINETFGFNGSLPGNTGNHDLFYVNNLKFSEGECVSMNVFRANSSQDDYFEEVLLYEPNTDSAVFVSLLEEIDTTGFDGKFHDFQMLVPEDGHGTDTSTTNYYFWVEIE